jgi:signal transduction histidine kinase
VRRLGLFPSIFGLVLLALVVSQLVAAALLVVVRPPPPAAMSVEQIVREIKGEEKANRLRVHLGESAPGPATTHAGKVFSAAIAEALGLPEEDVRLTTARMQRGRLIYVDVGTERGGPPRLVPTLVGQFEIHLRDASGQWRTYSQRGEGVFDTVEQRFVLLFIVGALIMILPAVYLARRLAQPFIDLADAAEQLGHNPGRPVAPIAGPPEAVRAGKALVATAQKLDAHVTDRVRMVGALAHDLRTPLTRLAFRAESLPPEVAADFTADITEMESMIAATLGFVRGSDSGGPRERLELCSLIERIAEDLAVSGKALATSCPELLVVEGEKSSLRRMLTNLIENALTYGGQAEARMVREGDWAVIEILDEGPGLSSVDLGRVFEPFYRAESSRNRNTGGIGLGLPYARLVAEGHGGEIELENRPTRGLCARVRLPLANHPSAAAAHGGTAGPGAAAQPRISATSTADQSVA